MGHNKIGIVTLVENLNYGNRLQNYAVDSIYKRLGMHPVTLVNHVLPPIVKAKRIVKKMIGISEDLPCPEKDPRFQLFEKFNEFIEFRHVYSWRGLAKEYDFFSTGSDQIWNPWYSYDLRWPFLEFAHAEKRIALAPSIGIDSIPERFVKRFRRGASGFSKLSVREYAGKKILDSMRCPDAIVLADPTIMVQTSEWLSASSNSAVPNEPYVFVYALSAQNDEHCKYFEKVAAGRKIVTLGDLKSYGGVMAGPAEFIGLIANADVVITDSFHGLVFSMLLDVPLTIVKRLGNGDDLSSRFDTLVYKFGLESALYENDGEFVLDPTVKLERLNKERWQYLDYLASYFDDDAIIRLAQTLNIDWEKMK